MIRQSTTRTASAPLSRYARNTDSELVIRLMMLLSSALRKELPIAERILMLKGLKPIVTRVTARMAKLVAVWSPQPVAGMGNCQPLEQHLSYLMAKNLQRAIKDMGASEVTDTEVSTHLQLWLATNLFDSLGGLIEYAARWNMPYPRNAWKSLHELYLYFRSRVDLADALESYAAESGVDLGIAYKRLLLLGLARRQTSGIDRLPSLFGMLTRLAEESRLERPESHSGAVGLFVVAISRDEPPYISPAVEGGFRGWVFGPAPGFLNHMSNSEAYPRAGWGDLIRESQ